MCASVPPAGRRDRRALHCLASRSTLRLTRKRRATRSQCLGDGEHILGRPAFGGAPASFHSLPRIAPIAADLDRPVRVGDPLTPRPGVQRGVDPAKPSAKTLLRSPPRPSRSTRRPARPAATPTARIALAQVVGRRERCRRRARSAAPGGCAHPGCGPRPGRPARSRRGIAPGPGRRSSTPVSRHRSCARRVEQRHATRRTDRSRRRAGRDRRPPPPAGLPRSTPHSHRRGAPHSGGRSIEAATTLARRRSRLPRRTTTTAATIVTPCRRIASPKDAASGSGCRPGPGGALNSRSRSTKCAPGMWPFAVIVHSGRPAERPANVEHERRIVCRKSCREFVTIEQERYHCVRIPQ